MIAQAQAWPAHRLEHQRCACSWGAQAVALATVSGARNSGLELLYAALGVSSPGQKARLDFVQSLINNGNASLHVGYQTKLLTS